MAREFEARITHLDGGAQVVVRGEIDVATAGHLREVLLRGVVLTRHLIIDMSGVEFMDASGLRVLDDALSRAGPSGSVRLIGSPDHVRRLLAIADLDGQLESQPERLRATPSPVPRFGRWVPE